MKPARKRQITLMGLGTGELGENAGLPINTPVAASETAPDTIQYLSSPSELRKYEQEVQSQADESRKKVEKAIFFQEGQSEKILFKPQILPGQNFLKADFRGCTVLQGIFSNSDLQKNSEINKPVLIGRIIARVTDDGHLRLSALDINSPSELQREKLKEDIVKAKKKAFSLDLAGLKPGMAEELLVDIDTGKRVINSVTSGNGARCFGLSRSMLNSDSILELDQAESVQLQKGDIVIVCSKKVLDALVMQTTNSIDTPIEYYNSAVANQLQSILMQSKDKDGKMDENKIFQQIATAYQDQMQVNNEKELLASGFLVYQLP